MNHYTGTYFITHVPPSILSANARPNRYAKNKAFQSYKDYVVMDIERQVQDKSAFPYSRIKLTVLWYLGNGKTNPISHNRYPEEAWGRAFNPRDWDNAVGSMKAFVDALVAAGVIPDDSFKHLHSIDLKPQLGKEALGRRCLHVFIEEV